MTLDSYVQGRWRRGDGPGVLLKDATTGEAIATASSAGVDFAAVLEHARRVGGPALRALTFHERAACLRALGKRLGEFKDEFYALSVRSGATKADSWIDIDGGIGTMLVFASKGSRELPNSHVYVDGPVETLSRGGSFVGQHICVPLEGAAVHINAFNFPVWGMLEKLAPTFLAGVPSIVKPATSTAYLTAAVVRRIIESGLLPEGSLQLVAGGLGDLFEHLTCQDAVSFTGSAATAARLRSHPVVIRNAVRFLAETDSVNSSILAPGIGPGVPEFDLFVAEVVREMTVKAGQKCTAIRRALVPREALAPVLAALKAALAGVTVGDPRDPAVRMGPLASVEQRGEVLARIAELKGEASLVTGDPEQFQPAGEARHAFLPPVLLLCESPLTATAVHEVEAFGPVATLMPYADVDEAVALARRGGGSLVASVFAADEAVAARFGQAGSRRSMAGSWSSTAPAPRNPPATARRSPISCTADRVAPAAARSWAACAACCITCSAWRCRVRRTRSRPSPAGGCAVPGNCAAIDIRFAFRSGRSRSGSRSIPRSEPSRSPTSRRSRS